MSAGAAIGWRMLFKLGMTAVAIAASAAFLVHQFRTGGVRIDPPDTVVLKTSYVVWQLPLTPYRLLQWFGAAMVLLILVLVPRHRTGKQGPVWMRAVAGGAVVLVVASLVLMQVLGILSLEPFFLVIPATFTTGWIWFYYFRSAPGPPIPRFSSRLARVPLPWIACGFGVCGLLVGVMSCRTVYDGLLFITDSHSQLAQARLIASGNLTLDLPQRLRDAISFPYAVPRTPSYSQYPPGHILLLVPLAALSLPPQLLTLLLSGATVALTVIVATRMGGRTTGAAAGLLLATSPFFVVMSGEAMNHMTTAFFLMLALLVFLPSPIGAHRAENRPVLLIIGGFALGWALMTRPLTAAAHGTVWIALWSLEALSRTPGTQIFRRSLLAAAGFFLPLTILLFYNYATTGHPLRMGYQVSRLQTHQLGFRSGGPAPYTPFDAVSNLATSIVSLEFLLFGWATGSWVLLVAWWVRTRCRRGEVILLALIFAQVGIYGLYHYHDLLVGPRFLFELLPILSILGGLALAPILRLPGRSAFAALPVLVLLSAGGLYSGLEFWRKKYAAIGEASRFLQHQIAPHLPLRRPTVFVVPTFQSETTGAFFPALPGEQPRWFVAEPQEEQARNLPELQSYEWIRFR